MSVVRTLFHGATAFNYFFAIWYDQMYVDLSKFASKKGDVDILKGRVKFLTMWNMLIQASFFTVCFLNDVIGNTELAPKRPPLIRKIQDVLLASLAFPLSMFVGLTFWALYAVDRELIFPVAIDPYFPSWLNHVMHTNIIFFVLLEFYTSFRRYPSRRLGLGILTGFILTYLVWVHVIHAYWGMWVYPVLDVLNFYGRLVFFVGLYGLVLVLYITGENLNQRIWFDKIKLSEEKDE